MRQFLILILTCAVTAIFLGSGACGGNGDSKDRAASEGTQKLRVITSISVLRDMAQQVGGERVQVVSLIPPGADVHTFQLVPKDLAQVIDTDVIIFNGRGLEVPVEEAVGNTVTPGVPLVELSEKLESEVLGTKGEESYEDLYDQGNPHLWLNVRFAMTYVEAIRDVFIEVDPAGASVYAANATRYLSELGELDREIEAQVGSIPEERRKLVTFHDAFPYFARRYGLELVGVVIKSPGREPSAKEMENLLDEIRGTGIPTVYVEPQFNPRILELLASDAGVQVMKLYSDALDEVANSYVEMMKYNVEQLVGGLR